MKMVKITGIIAFDEANNCLNCQVNFCDWCKHYVTNLDEPCWYVRLKQPLIMRHRVSTTFIPLLQQDSFYEWITFTGNYVGKIIEIEEP